MKKSIIPLLLLSGISAFASSPTRFIYVCKKPTVSTKIYQVTITTSAWGSDLSINVVNLAQHFSKSETTHQISVGYYGSGVNYISKSYKLHISTTAPLIIEGKKMYAPSTLQTADGKASSLLCEMR